MDENFTELRIVEPLSILKGIIPQVQRQSDLIILMSNFPYEENLELAHQIRGIDLIVGRQGMRFPNQRTEVRTPTGQDNHENRTFVVTAGDYLGKIDLEWSNQKLDIVSFQRVKVQAPIKQSAELTNRVEVLEGLFRDYCLRRYGRHPDETLCYFPPQISEDDFARFVLYVMLSGTHSELGLIHSALFDFSYWTDVIADHQLTIRECFLLMPENHSLLTVRLSGKTLNQLAHQSQTEKGVGHTYLHFLSVKPVLDDTDGEWLVHRLPIRDEELYASCSINVLINGGSTYHGLTTGSHIKTKFKMTSYLRFFPDGETKIVRDILIDSLLETNQLIPIGTDFLALPYLQRPLWRLQIQETGVSFNLNRAQNSEIYTNVTIPELQKAEITTLRLQGQVKVTRETASLLWENLLQTDVGQIKVGSNSFQEDKDDLDISTNLIFKSLNLTGMQPFIGLRFDTEYTTLEDRAHQRDIIVKIGMVLPDVWRFSSARLSYSRIVDVNTGGTKRKGLNALNLDAQLIIPGRKLQWINALHGTYFLPDTASNSERRQVLINAESQLKIPVVENIAFTPTFEAIFFKGMDEPVIAQEYLFSFRLSYAKDWKWQYMRYFLRMQKE